MKHQFKVLISVLLCSVVVLLFCGFSMENSEQKHHLKNHFYRQIVRTEKTLKKISVRAISRSRLQNYSLDINESKKPEITNVLVEGICYDDISANVNIYNLFGKNSHSGVVGLIGVPIEVTYRNIGSPLITITYNPDELRGIKESNIILLWYDEKNHEYTEVDDYEKDVFAHKISFNSDANLNSVVFVLVDKTQWFGTNTIDVSKYESDWERLNETGSIMELADKKWAFDNAPDFTVSTPVELASVVYYVNAAASSYEPVTITLNNDINLDGYDWVPMGWNDYSSHAFSGVIEGNGHVIYGMNIIHGYRDAGFIGYGFDVIMRNITFEKAYVKGSGCVGIAGGEVYGTSAWENINTNGIVDGGSDDYGGIIGREASISFINCSTSFLVDGKQYKFPSYRQYLLSKAEIKETFRLELTDGYEITRDDYEGFRNLCWHIELDGVQILERGAENELVLAPEYQWLKGRSGRHTIYLVAFEGSTYVRVSNIIEYTID